MSDPLADNIVRSALALHAAEPDLPALAVLDRAMSECRGATVDFGEHYGLDSEFFGLLAAAFDHEMDADLRAAIKGDDAEEQPSACGEACEMFYCLVPQLFEERYGLNGSSPPLDPASNRHVFETAFLACRPPIAGVDVGQLAEFFFPDTPDRPHYLPDAWAAQVHSQILASGDWRAPMRLFVPSPPDRTVR